MQSLREGDHVSVTDIITFPCKPVFAGQLVLISNDLVTPQMPQYGRERNHFVKPDDKSIYKELLLQGWQINCYIHDKLQRCVITSISKESNHLTVEMYDPDVGSVPYGSQYTITFEDIDCILLYYKGYTLTKIENKNNIEINY